MTERTVRSLAKEIAGVFYEQNRSPGFRSAFPTYKDYISGRWHLPNGAIKPYTPGWHFFVEIARRMMIQMLARKDVHENLKTGIYEALLEENMKATSAKARNIFQVKDV